MAYPAQKRPFWEADSSRAQQVLASLTLEQKIAQLLHVATWSNRGPAHQEEIQALIEDYGIGGLCFFQGTAVAQAEQTFRYQQKSKVPLMISIDGEWGLAMRLQDTLAYPYQIGLGQVEDMDLLYQMGADMADQCRKIGVHVNFAPVVDINTEPANPVIGFRSFGDNPERVATCALAYARGMEDNGVLAVLKHFPGHGDTRVDSHLDLPILEHGLERLRQVELAPFKQLIQAGIGGVMTGHLQVPVLDDRKRIGATLSRAISHDLLQDQLGFKGLVFTDALDMKGVSKYFSAPEINRMAFEAGNDVMLFCVDVPGSITAIRQSIEEGRVSEVDLDRRCLKQLQAKAWLNAGDRLAISAPPQLVTPDRETLIQNLHTATLHWRHTSIAPSLQSEEAWLHITPGSPETGDELAHHQLTGGMRHTGAPILTGWHQHGHTHLFHLRADQPEAMRQDILNQVRQYEGLWVSVGGLGLKAGNAFGMTESFRQLFRQVLTLQPIALVWQANPYALHAVPSLELPTLMAGPASALAIPGIIQACRGSISVPCHVS